MIPNIKEDSIDNWIEHAPQASPQEPIIPQMKLYYEQYFS